MSHGAGEGVDPVVMNEVAKMVAQSCSTCTKAMRAEGVKGGIKQADTLPNPSLDDCSHYLSCLLVLPTACALSVITPRCTSQDVPDQLQCGRATIQWHNGQISCVQV